MTADDLLQKHKDAVNACVSWKLGEITQDDAAKVEAAFRRALLALPLRYREGWQDINSAPKDEEIVLAGQYASGVWDIQIGRWQGKRWPFVGLKQPSHWRALPPTPDEIAAAPTPPVAPWNAAVEAAVKWVEAAKAFASANEGSPFFVELRNAMNDAETTFRALAQPDAARIGEIEKLVEAWVEARATSNQHGCPPHEEELCKQAETAVRTALRALPAPMMREGIWCVGHREGLCACKVNRKPAESSNSIETLCGSFVILPFGYKKARLGEIDCEKCNAMLAAAGGGGR